jgi:predicted nucleotide-binding protein
VTDRGHGKLNPDLLRKIATEIGKSEQYVREQVSKRARRFHVMSEVAQIVWAKELGLGTAIAFRRLDPHMQSQAQQLLAGSPSTSVEERPTTRRTRDATNRQTRRKSNTVMVVHGRDNAARDAMFIFLRTISLQPIEWAQALKGTKKGAPSVGEVVVEAFRQAAAVVVLLTPDDEARLRTKYRKRNEPEYERRLTGQPRPNVLFEAGRAFGSHPDSTILVQFGSVRPFSDTAGLHVVHMNSRPECRRDLANRLESAGCAVNVAGTDWLTAGNFPEDL